MRVIELVVGAAFLAGCAAMFRAILARSRPVPRWEAYHRFEGDRRRVYIRRGGELEPVGGVSPDDPSYEESFMLLMAQARERAATLNSER